MLNGPHQTEQSSRSWPGLEAFLGAPNCSFRTEACFRKHTRTGPFYYYTCCPGDVRVGRCTVAQNHYHTLMLSELHPPPNKEKIKRPGEVNESCQHPHLLPSLLETLLLVSKYKSPTLNTDSVSYLPRCNNITIVQSHQCVPAAFSTTFIYTYIYSFYPVHYFFNHDPKPSSFVASLLIVWISPPGYKLHVSRDSSVLFVTRCFCLKQ